MLCHQPQNLNSLAEKFEVTRQAVSPHGKILNECGLITIKKQGPQRDCEAQPEQLNEVAAWVDECRRFWNKKFKPLDAHLAKVQADKAKNDCASGYGVLRSSLAERIARSYRLTKSTQISITLPVIHVTCNRASQK